MNVLVTGANGFIGKALCDKLLADGYQVRGAVRSAAQMTALPSGVEGAMVGNIGPETDWSDALSGIEGIVHLAARVHVMRESAADPLAAFREVNVEGTKCLAIAAANAGVKRFVYISSVKVNGERTGAGKKREERPTSNTRLPLQGTSGQVERPTSNEKQKEQKSEVSGQEKTEDRSHPGEMRSAVVNEFHWAGRSVVSGQEKIEDRSHPGEMRSAVVNEFHWAGMSEGTPVESPIQLGKEVSLRPIGAYAPVGGQDDELKEAFSEKDVPEPQDPYAVSKWEAEQVLRDVAADTGMEVVVLRPPIVYGPGVRANFLRLLKMVKLGIPLPLASIKNRRSLIYVGNLIDAIVTCLVHPKAAGETFLVSDGQDVSTPELIRLMAGAMGKEAWLFSCPVSVLEAMGKITGRSAEVERIVGSLCVDSRKIRRVLGWKPLFTAEEGIRDTVCWYKSSACTD